MAGDRSRLHDLDTLLLVGVVAFVVLVVGSALAWIVGTILWLFRMAALAALVAVAVALVNRARR